VPSAAGVALDEVRGVHLDPCGVLVCRLADPLVDEDLVLLNCRCADLKHQALLYLINCMCCQEASQAREVSSTRLAKSAEN